MKKLVAMFAMFLLIAAVVVRHQPAAQVQYVPQAELCADTKISTLCSKLPAYIGPDPLLTKKGEGYSGLFGPVPTSKDLDVQTPFDNMAWQMFVALNWAASAVNQPPAKGLTCRALEFSKTYRKVSALFGNSPGEAPAPQPRPCRFSTLAQTAREIRCPITRNISRRQPTCR